MKLLCFAAIIAVSAVGVGFAQNQVIDVAVAYYPDPSHPYHFALSVDGQCYHRDGSSSWVLYGRPGDLAGQDATFVGVGAIVTPTSNTRVFAFTQSGELFRKVGTSDWEFWASVNADLGVVEDFTGFEVYNQSSDHPVVIAITGGGVCYIKNGTSSWALLGSIPVDTGVVPTLSTGIGDLKSMFR